MLRFEPDFYVHILHQELALVLHHASVWSNVSQIDVVVNAGANGAHKPGSLHGWNLAIDLDTEGDHASDTAQLAGYLARILPAGYDIVPEPTHVHVEWDPHRKPPVLEANFPGGDGVPR